METDCLDELYSALWRMRRTEALLEELRLPIAAEREAKAIASVENVITSAREAIAA